MEEQEEESVWPLIRSMHQHAFRSGEWARIIGVVAVNERCCYVVEFLDGKQDHWVITDSAAQYEFRAGGETR